MQLRTCRDCKWATLPVCGPDEKPHSDDKWLCHYEIAGEWVAPDYWCRHWEAHVNADSLSMRHTGETTVESCLTSAELVCEVERRLTDRTMKAAVLAGIDYRDRGGL